MSLLLESKKVRRTGFLPALLGGGALAAAFPLLNTLFRGLPATGPGATRLAALLAENGESMALLNVLLLALLACMLFHTENACGAGQKLRALPGWESAPFFGKAALLALSLLLLLALEAGALLLCALRAGPPDAGLLRELAADAGFRLLAALPALLLSLLLASLWKNMWVPLGLEVLGVFLAVMLPVPDGRPPLFPYSLALQAPAGQTAGRAVAAGVESVLLCALEPAMVWIRRTFL